MLDVCDLMLSQTKVRTAKNITCVDNNHYVITRRTHNDHGCTACAFRTTNGGCRYLEKHDRYPCEVQGRKKRLIRCIRKADILFEWSYRKFDILIERCANRWTLWLIY